ncbi:MAG: hypothetical protein UH850_00110 [Paludibacteraceae bacterium]|nr:hypothetical protein [Paludibacteraceae bacterium]
MITLIIISVYIVCGLMCTIKFKSYLNGGDYADKMLAVSLFPIFLLCIALDRRELRKRARRDNE